MVKELCPVHINIFITQPLVIRKLATNVTHAMNCVIFFSVDLLRGHVQTDTSFFVCVAIAFFLLIITPRFCCNYKARVVLVLRS